MSAATGTTRFRRVTRAQRVALCPFCTTTRTVWNGRGCGWTARCGTPTGTCLDDLGTRLKDLIDRHGPASVAFYFSTMESAGFRMAEALHAAIGTPAKFSPLTIDGTAKPLISADSWACPVERTSTTPTS